MAKPKVFSYLNMLDAFKKLGIIFTEGAFAEYRRRYGMSTKFPAVLGGDKKGQERYFDLSTAVRMISFIVTKKRLVIDRAIIKKALIDSIKE